MNRKIKWALAFVLFAGLAVFLVWSFSESRGELAREQAQERPVKMPSRITRTPDGETILTLNRETQTRVALTLETLIAARQSREVAAYGFTLDPASLVTRTSELSSAEASMAASSAEFERVTTLYREGENASRRSLEDAEARLRVDESRVRLAIRRITAAWGQQVAALDPAAREKLVERLVRRQTAFARVVLPAGEAVATRPRNARIVILGEDDRPLAAARVGYAPTADPRNQGQSFLVRFDTQGTPVPPGTAITAYLSLPGAPRQGVVIPRDALVRFEGRAWVYVQTGDTTFSRRSVSLEYPAEGGWFVPSGFSDGVRVVVGGAQILLSEEFKSQVQILEEGESE